MNFAVSIVAGALLDAIVLAYTKVDVDGSDATNPWSIVLERLWVVVIANFIFTFVTEIAIELVATGSLGARILGAFTLPLAAAMVFAECIAVVSDDERWWWLPVASVGGSLRTSWQSAANMSRAIVLFALQLLPIGISGALEPLLKSAHVPLASFWSEVPLGILLTIPLDVLIVLAFFDASGYSRKSTVDE